MNMYKELTIWQDSIKLIKKVYGISEQLPKSEEYNLKQQLKRAVTSVALNIAEGKSRKTAKDFSNFLTIAVGSLSETDSILVICEELGFLQVSEDLKEEIAILGRKINSLRNKLTRSGS